MRKDKVLVIAAMDEEVAALKKYLDDCKEASHYGIQYFKGQLGEQEVFLAKSGIGKVNAAMTSSLLIDYLEPDYLINIGSAGGLQKDQAIGDVLVSETLLYHDFDIGENTYDDDRFIFKSSEKLGQKAISILREMKIPYHYGLLLSGDQFVTKKQGQLIAKKFPDAQAVDMESAAIASVARQMGKRLIILRSISDLILEENNDLDFEEYLPIASKQSALICKAIIKKGAR